MLPAGLSESIPARLPGSVRNWSLHATGPEAQAKVSRAGTLMSAFALHTREAIRTIEARIRLSCLCLLPSLFALACAFTASTMWHLSWEDGLGSEIGLRGGSVFLTSPSSQKTPLRGVERGTKAYRISFLILWTPTSQVYRVGTVRSIPLWPTVPIAGLGVTTLVVLELRRRRVL